MYDTTTPAVSQEGPAPTLERSRDLASLARKIRAADRSMRGNALAFYRRAIQGGEAAIEAKALLRRGEFGPWLESTCEVSPRHARRWMTLARSGVSPEQVLAGGGIRALLKAAVETDTVSETEPAGGLEKGSHDPFVSISPADAGCSHPGGMFCAGCLAHLLRANVEAARARIGTPGERDGDPWMLSDREFVAESEGVDWDAVFQAAIEKARAA